MGLRQPCAYTSAMTHEFPPEYQCGDLRICPALGTITGACGAMVRLGPVNMKVLATLLGRAGNIVSRAELFEAVWHRQVVSEDALTRCVSDIRSELRTFSGHDDWIETLPKRGYRWLTEVREIEPSEQLANPARKDEAVDVDAGPEPAKPLLSRRLLSLALRGSAYLIALAVMAVAMVWAIDRIAGERSVVVAILPTAAAPELAEQAAELDLALMKHLLQNDSIRLLSPSAIDARPDNPFPFFSYEFGARWLIEGDLRKIGGAVLLTLTVADARTGIAEMQVTDEWPVPVATAIEPAPAVFQSLTEFIDTALRE